MRFTREPSKSRRVLVGLGLVFRLVLRLIGIGDFGLVLGLVFVLVVHEARDGRPVGLRSSGLWFQALSLSPREA